MADKRKLQGMGLGPFLALKNRPTLWLSVFPLAPFLPLPTTPGEIERCLKKVSEGVETFEDIWKKVSIFQFPATPLEG